MTEWKPIESAPQDELILLRKSFPEVETPCIVVGEIVTFKGKIHHLWRGAYDKVISTYKSEVDESWDERFNEWAEL